MEEIDLKELFSIFWNKKFQIISVIVVFIIIGAVYTMGFKTPVYTSSTTLLLASASTDSTEATSNSITTTDVTLNSNLIETYSELVTSKKVLGEVIENLGIDEDESTLENNITVSAVSSSQLIEIAVTHENANYAARIANEIARVFAEQIIPEYYNMSNVYIVDEAEVPDAPSNINHAKDVIIFAFVGLIISVAYVFILNMLDNTVKTAEEIEKLYGIHVLVSIPTIESFTNQKGGKR